MYLDASTGIACVFDGWAVPAARRFVLDMAGAAPSDLIHIPDYRPGLAGPDCPYPILAKGPAKAPKFRFGKSETPRQILAAIEREINA